MNHRSGAEAHPEFSGDTAWESHPVPVQPVARQQAVPLGVLQQAVRQQAAMQQAALQQQQAAIQHLSMQQQAIQHMQQAAMIQAAMQQGVIQPGPMYHPAQHYQQAAPPSSSSQSAAPPPMQQAQQQAQMQAQMQAQTQQQAQQSQAQQQMQQMQQPLPQQMQQMQQQLPPPQPQQQQRRRQDAADGDGDISAEALQSLLMKLPEEGDEERVEAMQNARPRSLSGENKVLEMSLPSPRHGGGVGGRGALSSVQSASAGRARFRSVGSFSGFSTGMVDGQAPPFLSTVVPLQAAHESSKVTSAPDAVKQELQRQQQQQQQQREEGADSTEDDEPVTRLGALSHSAPVSRTTSTSGLSKRSSLKAGSARLIEGEAVGEAAGETAKAIKVPADGEFVIGLEGPMMDLLWPGGPELNALQHQKLLDATELLQSMNMHPLEPLRLYTKMQLYELMTSMAESWKNSGKAAWKKRINKIKGNARARKNGNGQLDKKELLEIAELEARIRQRVIWEKQQKARLGGTQGSDNDDGSDSDQGGAKVSRKRALGDAVKQEN
jgi:hypothetical protein